jgi:hypothetical protein
MGAGVGWVMGAKVHGGRIRKELNAKHKLEHKALYSQYYNDVYALQNQNSELADALEQMGVRMR